MDLVADVGGTYARFALIEDGRVILPWATKRSVFASLQDAIDFYLTTSGASHVDRAAIAWAAPPVRGDTIQLGWSPAWQTSLPELQSYFGFRQLLVVNDMIATARGLPLLRKDDLQVLNAGDPLPLGNKLVIAPGNGFSVGLAVWAGTKWAFMPSEAGLSTPPLGMNERERGVLEIMGQRHGPLTLSILLSGRGLRYLHQTICEMDTDGGNGCSLQAFEVIDAALAGGSPSADEATGIFLSMLWRTMEGLALTFKANGGVYLGGALCRRLAPLLAQTSATRLGVLRTHRVSLIEAEHPAFVGLQDMMSAAPVFEYA